MSSRKGYSFGTKVDALAYALDVWEALDTPVALSCFLLARYGEHEQLVRKAVDPLHYSSPESFSLDYQAVKLLSKYPYLNTGIDCRAVARKKFYESEHQCLETNARIREYLHGPLPQGRLGRVITRAQDKIADILGDVPSYERMEYSFGPGAAYGVRGETSAFNKVTSALECTYAMASELGSFLAEFPGWIPEGTQEVRLIPGSQLTFVPKDAKTERPICIEPLLNGLMQKGYGTYIRRRLKRHGISLDDQTINQQLAQKAYTERLATVDFASASDTIAYLLVMLLLPHTWFEALDVARCPRYEDEKVWKSFQKFSSMGNAYTFELESLIFYCVAFACMEELGIQPKTGINLSVYGDDVIIPQEAYDLFAEVSAELGFTVSHEKSFHEGCFFESCGTDYFAGVLVRPFLIKKKLVKLTEAFYAANTCLRMADRLPHKGTARTALAHRLYGVRLRVIQRIPRHLRVRGPEGYGDGHLVSTFDESRPSRHPVYDGWWFTSYSERAIRVERSEWPMAYALYFTRLPAVVHSLTDIPEPPDNGTGYAVRGRTRLTRTKQLCHGEWRGYLM